MFDKTTEIFDNIEEIEKYLLKYINTINFKNNPEYIQKWIFYYKQKNMDVKILFLMKYKKIALNYHFIYIELSRFFSRKNKKDISLFILKEALQNEVCEQKILEDEIQKYQNVTPASFSKAYTYLNPVGFTVIGNIWNEFKIKYNYDKNLFKNGSFEEYRLTNYYKFNFNNRINKNNNVYNNRRYCKSDKICLYTRYKYKYSLDEVLKIVPEPIKIIYLIRVCNFLEKYKIQKVSDLYLNENFLLQHKIYEENKLFLLDNCTKSSLFGKILNMYVENYTITDCIKIIKNDNLKRIVIKSQIYFLEKTKSII